MIKYWTGLLVQVLRKMFRFIPSRIRLKNVSRDQRTCQGTIIILGLSKLTTFITLSRSRCIVGESFRVRLAPPFPPPPAHTWAIELAFPL